MVDAPQLFPESFVAEMEEELIDAGHVDGIDGDSRCLSNDPRDPQEQFRTIKDHYSGIEMPYFPFAPRVDEKEIFVDYSIVRLMSRALYTSELSVHSRDHQPGNAYCQLRRLLTPTWTIFADIGILKFYEEHGAVEVLLKAERVSSFWVPWSMSLIRIESNF